LLGADRKPAARRTLAQPQRQLQQAPFAQAGAGPWAIGIGEQPGNVLHEGPIAAGQRQHGSCAQRRERRTGRRLDLQPPLNACQADAQRLGRDRLEQTDIEELVDAGTPDVQLPRRLRDRHEDRPSAPDEASVGAPSASSPGARLDSSSTPEEPTPPESGGGVLIRVAGY
jgi:hypothetical protein